MNQSRRRTLHAAAATTLGVAAPPVAFGRTNSPVRIGFLVIGDQAYNAEWLAEFERSLSGRGWTIGQDMVIEQRFGGGDSDRLAEAARTLLASKPDVLVTGGVAGATALRSLTTTIPIVAVNLIDPVEVGLARSLSRPGGNVTGMTASIGIGVLGKRLQMLRMFLPRARRVAVLRARGEYTAPQWQGLVDAASTLDVTLQPIDVTGDGFPAAFAAIASARPDALFLVGQGTLVMRMEMISDFALRERLAATHALKRFARAGLLFSFGIDPSEGYRRAASYVDRILRGANAGDLPIEQPNRYELTINRRTAERLGVRIPPDLLLQADEVIG